MPAPGCRNSKHKQHEKARLPSVRPGTSLPCPGLRVSGSLCKEGVQGRHLDLEQGWFCPVTATCWLLRLWNSDRPHLGLVLHSVQQWHVLRFPPGDGLPPCRPGSVPRSPTARVGWPPCCLRDPAGAAPTGRVSFSAAFLSRGLAAFLPLKIEVTGVFFLDAGCRQLDSFVVNHCVFLFPIHGFSHSITGPDSGHL